MFHDSAYMVGMHWLWWLLWLPLLGIIFFSPWGRSARRDKPSRETPPETPPEVLRRRLAAGEITPQEYEQCKALLDRDAPGTG